MLMFSDLWEQFTYHCRVKRRSSNTLAYYGTTAKAFTAFLEQHELGSLEVLTVQHLRAYMQELEVKGLGPGGLHAHVRALKAIFNWAYREELIERNPSLKLERPNLPKLRLPAVTPLMLLSVMRAAKSSEQPFRDTALLITLFDTGIRVSEFTALRLEDLRFERGLIRVQGKGDRERFVPLGSTAMTEITRYQRRERTPSQQHEQRVFLGRYGEPITRSGVATRLTNLGKTVNLTRDQIAPHAFRRGFAVQFLRNGGDVFTL